MKKTHFSPSLNFLSFKRNSYFILKKGSYKKIKIILLSFTIQENKKKTLTNQFNSHSSNWWAKGDKG